MAEFSKLVITNKGQALLAKMIAGSGNIEFTQISASSTAYTTDAQLVELTSLTDVKQTSLISKITRTNEVAIEVEAAFTNTELTEGYHMKALGLYAKDPDEEEILYAVTREISGNCYMPAYNGITVSGAYVQLITTVGNAESVSLEVNQAAVATIKDIQDLQSKIIAAEQNIGNLKNAQNEINESIDSLSDEVAAKTSNKYKVYRITANAGDDIQMPADDNINRYYVNIRGNCTLSFRKNQFIPELYLSPNAGTKTITIKTNNSDIEIFIGVITIIYDGDGPGSQKLNITTTSTNKIRAPFLSWNESDGSEPSISGIETPIVFKR